MMQLTVKNKNTVHGIALKRQLHNTYTANKSQKQGKGFLLYVFFHF